MRAFAALLLGLSVAGCAPVVRSDPSARALESDLHCGREFPTSAATWIDNAVDFETAYRRINRISIETLVELPNVDFGRDGVLLVEMGRRGTGGYSIDLATEQVTRAGDAAQVVVHWTDPRPDAVLPQVITSPCVFIMLSRGDYERVQVFDEYGRLRAEATLP
ncbi:MAG: protease complex subunit PrcB family protein [Thiohalomonadaceae bacterium]